MTNFAKLSIFFCLIFTVLFSAMMICPLGAQIIQSCGQGVVIFGDGSVVLSGWKTFLPEVMSPNAVITNTRDKILDYPTKVEFKKNMDDTTLVCFEDTIGSHCVKLEVLRKAK